MPTCPSARRCRVVVLAACVLAVVACTGGPPAHHAARQAAPRAPGAASPGAAGTPVQNALPGDPRWRITHPGHLYQLEGFADRADVQPGTSFRLFVSTTAPSFRVRAFRQRGAARKLA